MEQVVVQQEVVKPSAQEKRNAYQREYNKRPDVKVKRESYTRQFWIKKLQAEGYKVEPPEVASNGI